MAVWQRAFGNALAVERMFGDAGEARGSGGGTWVTFFLETGGNDW